MAHDTFTLFAFRDRFNWFIIHLKILKEKLRIFIMFLPAAAGLILLFVVLGVVGETIVL